MTDAHTPTCPECGSKLTGPACPCGWKPAGTRGRAAPQHTTSACTWRSGELICRYPNGLAQRNSAGGFCAFHRATPSGADAARIAHESHDCTPEQYLERLKAMQRASTRPAPPTRRGNVGSFAAHSAPPERDDPFGDSLAES